MAEERSSEGRCSRREEKNQVSVMSDGICPNRWPVPYVEDHTCVEQVRSPYPSCYNFVEFFLRRSCIKSCTLVVTFSLTNSPGLVFFGPQVPPGLLSI